MLLGKEFNKLESANRADGRDVVIDVTTWESVKSRKVILRKPDFLHRTQIG